MKVGRLKYRLQVLAEVKTPDGAGGHTSAWAAHGSSCLCDVTYPSANRIASDTTGEILNRVIITARRPALPADFSPAMRVRVKAEDFKILSATPKDRDFTAIVAERLLS